jgi:transposase
VKTDRIDARTLAQLLRADLVAECYVPNKENREKRALIRERASLTKTRTEDRNKIHDLLAKYEYTHDFSDLFGKENITWPAGLAWSGDIILVYLVIDALLLRDERRRWEGVKDRVVELVKSELTGILADVDLVTHAAFAPIFVCDDVLC